MYTIVVDESVCGEPPAAPLQARTPVAGITESLFSRYRPEKEDTFAGKFAAGLRNEFGGHAIERHKT